MIVGKLTQNE
jgi:hypothetical protein